MSETEPQLDTPAATPRRNVRDLVASSEVDTRLLGMVAALAVIWTGFHIMSDGKFILQFFEPGALIPTNECFDAASKGSVESCWSTAGYDVGKYPALSFFTSVPFGPSYGEYFAWKKFGGGDDLKNKTQKSFL